MFTAWVPRPIQSISRDVSEMSQYILYICYVLLLPFIKVLGPNDQLQKKSLGKSNERTLILELCS